MKCNLSAKIKELCKSKGIQQKDLAQKMGIAPESLSRAINGNPQLSTIENLAEALDVDVSELFAPKHSLPSLYHPSSPLLMNRNFVCLVCYQDKSFVTDSIESIPSAIKLLYNIHREETEGWEKV